MSLSNRQLRQSDLRRSAFCADLRRLFVEWKPRKEKSENLSYKSYNRKKSLVNKLIQHLCLQHSGNFFLKCAGNLWSWRVEWNSKCTEKYWPWRIQRWIKPRNSTTWSRSREFWSREMPERRVRLCRQNSKMGQNAYENWKLKAVRNGRRKLRTSAQVLSTGAFGPFWRPSGSKSICRSDFKVWPTVGCARVSTFQRSSI